MRREDKRSLEQGHRDTEIRRETATRASMEARASGREASTVTPHTDEIKNPSTSTHEQVRGGTREPQRPPRQAGKLPLPD